MVFRRRDRRPILQILAELLWPRGGWARAFYYVRHRLRRLPGTPETIARGVLAGVFTTFTPFYGLHFATAFILARILQGNALAAILATFFGNPLTYLPIGVVSLRTGYLLLGRDWEPGMAPELLASFGRAGRDLWHNFLALFTPEHAHWESLGAFYDEVFLPWMVGGVIPGIIAGIIAYYLSVPVIRAYQKRRAARLRKKLDKLRKKASRQADAMGNPD